MKIHFWKPIVACLVVFVLTAFEAPFNRKTLENYIDAYKHIAISEMKRAGIPASIKLAQGILESDFGRSLLATEARNHFGIKCGGDWSGNTYYVLDDDKDSSGLLIESCFRVFESDEESYFAHSEFLRNPSKRARYGFLFDLASTDYVGWANGLKFAGYATDPSYPQKLISIIEKYQLYKYDTLTNATNDNLITANDNASSNPVIDRGSANIEEKSSSRTKFSTINGLKMVYASGGESIHRIALMSGLKVSELLEYNEEIYSMDYILKPNEIVYLERKKKNIEGEAAFHTVQKGESMYTIAQKYGIRLESLLAKNNLTPDTLPLEGQEISLVKQLHKNQTPKFRMVERFDSYVDLGSLR